MFGEMMKMNDFCVNYIAKKQISLDKLIVYMTETYIESHFNLDPQELYNFSETGMNFMLLKNDKALRFFDFGFMLIEYGTDPSLLNIMMQNTYEIIIENAQENELINLRLQLLFLKYAIQLLHKCDYKDYYDLINLLSSNKINVQQYESALKERWQSILEFNPEREPWLK